MALTRILLMHGESRKPASFVDMEEITVRILRDVARNLFDLKDEKVIIQTYCQTFEEYVDAEDDVVIANGEKVRVIKQQEKPTNAEIPPPQQAESSPSISGLNFENATQMDWHIKWTVPSMPAQIEEKLVLKKPLSCSEREVMLSTIYMSIAPRFLFPKSAQYFQVVDKLMEKYPSLLTPEPDFAKSLWKQRLMYRFQNGRKREHKDVPETILRKRRKNSTPNPPTTKNNSAPNWGIPHYLPAREHGEDNESIAQHIEALKLEKTKKRPNYEKICLLMEKTLPERRQKIINDNLIISSLKIDYPWLFEEEEILAEFTRISGIDIQKAIRSSSLKAAPAVHQLIKNKKKVSQTLKDFYKETSDEESKIEATLMAIPELLNESFNSVLALDEEACGSPAIIKKDDEFILRIDAVEISRSITLTRALICFIASFYVFNLAYPKPCKKSLAFIQRIFLKISDNEKVDRSVLQLQEKIYNISV